MGNYLICKKKKGKKISVEVCRKTCKFRAKCKEYQAIITESAVMIGNFPSVLPLAGEEVLKEAMPVSDGGVKNAEDEASDTDVHYHVASYALEKPAKDIAHQLYEQALSLKAEIEARWFRLGKILGEIFEGRHYITLGHKTWKDFCEVALGPLELTWRTADYLRTTYEKCYEVGIGEEVAGEIGWSRLKEIVPIVTTENKDHWIDVARKKESTVHVLWRKVQVALGKKTEKEVEILPEQMLFSLFPEQKQIVDLALEVAGRVDGSDKKGHLLSDVIAPSFLAEYPPEFEAGSKAKMVVKLLGRFEGAFKVMFQGEVIDGETGEILVGSSK